MVTVNTKIYRKASLHDPCTASVAFTISRTESTRARRTEFGKRAYPVARIRSQTVAMAVAMTSLVVAFWNVWLSSADCVSGKVLAKCTNGGNKFLLARWKWGFSFAKGFFYPLFSPWRSPARILKTLVKVVGDLTLAQGYFFSSSPRSTESLWNRDRYLKNLYQGNLVESFKLNLFPVTVVNI